MAIGRKPVKGERFGGRSAGNKGIERLTAKQVSSLNVPGMYADGGGLYLRVAPSGTKSWMFRYMQAGKAHNMGLGPTDTVTLAEARALARQHRKAKLDGHDPIQQRRATVIANAAASVVHTVPTFAEAAEEYVTSQERMWKDKGEGGKWRSMLRTWAEPLMALPVDQITSRNVIGVLEPIWEQRYHLATRLQNRIERILTAATVREYRQGDNPARWKGYLDEILIASPEAMAVTNRAALATWEDVPAFVAELRAINDNKARAIEFIILTATRAGEVAQGKHKSGMQWSEVDFDTATWTIPPARMKGKVQHRIPLSARAVEILRGLPSANDREGRVFPHGYDTISEYMRSLRPGITLHGFRSSFTSWAKAKRVDYDVRELCLAHNEGSKTVKAYDREDLLDLRRPVMTAWAEFCEHGQTPVAAAA